jgi:hemoglobin
VIVEDGDVFSRIGEEGFQRLVAAFYRRIPEDDVLGPMYQEDNDLEGAEQRLRDFLVFRFGGPPRYLEQRGHPRLRMRHIRFPVDQTARDRWLLLMGQALDEAAFPSEVEQFLRQFFEGTATFLINRSEGPSSEA